MRQTTRALPDHRPILPTSAKKRKQGPSVADGRREDQLRNDVAVQVVGNGEIDLTVVAASRNNRHRPEDRLNEGPDLSIFTDQQETCQSTHSDCLRNDQEYGDAATGQKPRQQP